MLLNFAGSLGPSKLNKRVNGEWSKIPCERGILLDLAYDEKEKILPRVVLTVENLPQTSEFGNRIDPLFI